MKKILTLFSLIIISFPVYLQNITAETLLTAPKEPDAGALSLSLYIDNSTPSQPKIECSWGDKIVLKSGYAQIDNKLTADLWLSDINLSDFSFFMKDIKNIVFQGGYIKRGTLSLKTEDSYSITGNIEIENLAFIYPAKSLSIPAVKKDLEFKGNISLTPLLTLPKSWDKEFKTKISYYLQGKIKQAQIKNFPFLDTLSGLSAGFSLNKEKLSFIIEDAAFPQKTSTEPNHLYAKGDIPYSNSSPFSIEAKTNLSVNQFIQTLKEIKEIPIDYTGEGQINLECIVKGNFGNKDFDYHLDYKITGAAYAGFTNIAAAGFLKKDAFVLEESVLNYKNIPLKIAGRCEDFTSPKIELTLNSGSINAHAKAAYAKDAIEITECRIKGVKTDILSKSHINLVKPSFVKIEGFGVIDLNEILEILAGFQLNYPALKQINPDGSLNLKFSIEGGPAITDWQLKIAGVSENLKLYKIDAKDITIELYKDKNEFTLSPFTAKLGNGTLDLRVKIDYLTNTTVLNVTAADIELADLAEQLNLQTKDLSGKLCVEAYVKNENLLKLDKLDGEGKILVKDGNLWQINLLKGLGGILYLPNFETITFQEASSDLNFKGENIVFKNLELNSSQIKLKGGGAISVTGNIDFELFPELSPFTISDSKELQEMINQLLGKNLGVQIKGTLKKPQYKITPLFTSPVEGITNIFKGVFDNLR